MLNILEDLFKLFLIHLRNKNKKIKWVLGNYNFFCHHLIFSRGNSSCRANLDGHQLVGGMDHDPPTLDRICYIHLLRECDELTEYLGRMI